METKFSPYIILPLAISLILLVINIYNIREFMTQGTFLIDFFRKSSTPAFTWWGGYLSSLLLLIFFIYLFYKEIISKLVAIRLSTKRIKITYLFGTREFDTSQIKKVVEKKMATRFGLKNKIIEINIQNNIYYISELYVKNYEEIKNMLDKLEIEFLKN